jgi:hypothetical protein
MVLSTTISQQCWTNVTLFAHAHGKTVSEVVEELLTLGSGNSPFAEFYEAWYQTLTPEATYEELLGGREKLIARANALKAARWP